MKGPRHTEHNLYLRRKYYFLFPGDSQQPLAMTTILVSPDRGSANELTSSGTIPLKSDDYEAQQK